MVEEFVTYYRTFAIQTNPTSQVKICRDPNDDYLFSLARDTQSDFLISKDKDVLSIVKYSNTITLNLNKFLEHLKKNIHID